MEERDPELPVATLRPRHLGARIASTRGAIARWCRDRLRLAFAGRHAPLLLTAIVFSGMMLAMGYVADRAQRAAEAIDQMHRQNRGWAQPHHVTYTDVEIAESTCEPDPWAAAATRPTPTAMFYIQ